MFCESHISTIHRNAAGFSGPKLIWCESGTFAVVWQLHNWNSFGKWWMSRFPGLGGKVPSSSCDGMMMCLVPMALVTCTAVNTPLPLKGIAVTYTDAVIQAMSCCSSIPADFSNTMNAEPLWAQVTTERLYRKIVGILDWPPSSPDLSFKENVWCIMKTVQNKSTKIPVSWATAVVHRSKNGKDFHLRSFNN